MGQPLSQKFNGKGRLIIRANHEMTFMNRNLQRGDVLTTFNDVDFQLVYTDVTTRSTTAATVLANSEYYPFLLQVNAIPNSTSLKELMYSDEKEHNVTFTKIYRILKRQLEENNTFFLPIGEHINILKVKAFDDTGALVAAAADEIQRSITITVGDYNWVELQVSLETIGSTYLIERPDYPYLSLEVQIEGKEDKEQALFVLKIYNATLINLPEYDFNSATVFGGNLNFAIVKVQDNPLATLEKIIL